MSDDETFGYTAAFDGQRKDFYAPNICVARFEALAHFKVPKPQQHLVEVFPLENNSLFLGAGGHADPDDGMCLLEAVAFLTGVEHSDEPECVSPILAEMGRALNDKLPTKKRQKLKEILPYLLNTRGDGLDVRRAWMLFDWVIRVSTPAWLDLAGLEIEAESLRSLPVIKDAAHLRFALARLESAERATQIQFNVPNGPYSYVGIQSGWSAYSPASNACSYAAEELGLFNHERDIPAVEASDIAASVTRQAARIAFARDQEGMMDAITQLESELEDSQIELFARVAIG